MKTLGQVIISPSDKRTYKAIKLENQLQCLIIRDIDALKSSAALSMGVGSFKDPKAAQGIAHYLQHMLFMGTKKYPDQNDYSNFITKNGGSNNAYTSQQQTNYMLEISSSAFQPALDRFAQFFISPLLKQQSAEKQLEAVHSEHQKNLLNDLWRKFQLTKHLAKQQSAFNKFSTGDKNSLSNPNLQQILSNFYQENYSSNLMKLVIYGNQQLQTLQKWVVQKFSVIPNKNYTRFSLEEQPFDQKVFKKFIKLVPVKDLKKLELIWILPDKKQHYRNHPGNYISNLIGHQGKGSILSYLIKQGLATSLSSSSQDEYNIFTEFSINIQLTEKGLSRTNDIIGYILHYIQMLKQNQCPQWFFQEIKLIRKLQFQFMDKKKGMGETSTIAKNMLDRKIQEVIVYPYLMESWKPELIRQYLKQMTTENLIVICQAKKYQPECTQQQPIYKSKYTIEDLTNLQPIKCDVSLPEKNIFLPKDLSTLPLQPQKLPTLIMETQFIDTFYKHDHQFGLPKANINLRLIFDGNFSTLQDVGRAVLIEMLKQSLRQFVYLAGMAQIQVQISFVSYFSLDIKFKGFRDSLRVFVVQYLKRIFQFVPSDVQLYQTLIQKHRRKYKNGLLNQPYRLVYEKGATAMRNKSAHSDQRKIEEIENLTLDQVVRLNKCWKKKIFMQSYFSGNIKEQQSKQIATQIQKFLLQHAKPLKKQSTGQMRTVQLKSNKIVILQQALQSKQQQNSAILVHYQVGQLTIQSELLLKIVELAIKQPAFDYLRTKEQLGYIVFCLAQDHRGVGGLTFIVQSQVKSSYQIITYVDKFVNQLMRQIFEKLTQEQLQTYKNALKSSKEEKDKNLSAQTLRYWSEIVKHKYIFNRKQIQLQKIPQIKLDEIKQFIKRNFYDNPKRIELHLTSNKKQQINLEAKNKRANSENISIYRDYQEFIRKSQLFPDYYAPNPK